MPFFEDSDLTTVFETRVYQHFLRQPAAVAPTDRTSLPTQVVSTGAAEFHRRTNISLTAKERVCALADFVASGPQRGSATFAEAMWAVDRKLLTSLGVRHR